MSSSPFCRYELRAKDLDGARAFYTDLLGTDFWLGPMTIAPLPERAAAMGAPQHWVGDVAVDDVDASAKRFVEMGAQQLGPTQHLPDGSSRAVFRDPFGGAVIGLTSGQAVTHRAAAKERVAWHILHTREHERAFAAYASLLGWTITEELDLGDRGKHQMFACDASGETVGSVANTALSPQIHVQWMHFFRVPDIQRSLAKVAELGGIALPAMETPTGDLVAPCDDPQGGAFALYQVV